MVDQMILKESRGKSYLELTFLNDKDNKKRFN